MQQTKHLFLRLVQKEDIDFILSLRLNPRLNQFLGPVNEDKSEQLKWIHNYKKREAEGQDYYFVIVDKYIGSLGLVRVYDIDTKSKSFAWGSFIIKEDRPKYAAIESTLLSLEFAYNELNLELAKIDVKLANKRADNFYIRFGMMYLEADNDSKYYQLSKTRYLQLKYSQYYKFLIN